jgi:hypothetical protein
LRTLFRDAKSVPGPPHKTGGDGQVETIRDVAVDQIVTVTEGKGITGRTGFSGR